MMSAVAHGGAASSWRGALRGGGLAKQHRCSKSSQQLLDSGASHLVFEGGGDRYIFGQSDGSSDTRCR